MVKFGFDVSKWYESEMIDVLDVYKKKTQDDPKRSYTISNFVEDATGFIETWDRKPVFARINKEVAEFYPKVTEAIRKNKLLD
jgi:hypothetical protein